MIAESKNTKADPNRMALLKSQLSATVAIAEDFYEVDLELLEDAYAYLVSPNAQIFETRNYSGLWIPLPNGLRMEYRFRDFFSYGENADKAKQPNLMAPMIQELIERFKKIGSRRLPRLHRALSRN